MSATAQRSGVSWAPVAAVAGVVAIGYATISVTLARTSPRMLPWVLGRGFGIAAYLSLTGLTMVGLWLRHPWRVNRAGPGAQSLHHVHSVLAPLTLLLIAGHVTALAVDKYAGVGWSGAFIPGRSGYRPLEVALGTLSVYAGLIVGLTAALAGWVGGRVWLRIHRLAIGAICLAWTHAVLTGSDEHTLLPIYIVSAAAVVGLFVSRRLATPLPSMADPMPRLGDQSPGRRRHAL